MSHYFWIYNKLSKLNLHSLLHSSENQHFYSHTRIDLSTIPYINLTYLQIFILSTTPLYILKMTSAYPNQPIAPKTQKPSDYYDIPIIKRAIAVLDGIHHEYDVSRVTLLILRHYFPILEDWTIVPEFMVAERKRPDYLIEKYNDDTFDEKVTLFEPKIAFELKSGKGGSLMDALDQSVRSMPTLVDEHKNDFSIFLVIWRGKHIGFFEYHNYRSLLTDNSVVHYKGAIPFNHPQEDVPVGRPHYKGTGAVTHYDEWAADPHLPPNRTWSQETLGQAFLNVDIDTTVIQSVLLWMKTHSPLKGPNCE